MTNCEIKFVYNQSPFIIHCSRNDLMKNIINSYGQKSELPVNEFYFIYKGEKINPESTLAQVDEKETAIKILAYKIEARETEAKKEKSNYIKAVQNDEPAVVEVTSDYGITLESKSGKKT